MGRPQLTQEEIRENALQLIRAAQTLIVRDGMAAVTIRNVAAEAGVSSASLYKYFRDLDELILFACVDFLKSYAHELVKREKMLKNPTPAQRYLLSWELFCKQAFTYPECLRHMFFGKHSDRLTHVIRAYYGMFPELLTEMSETFQVMMQGSRLRQRNLEVLRPLLGGQVMEERLLLINDLTVSYFRMLLEEKIADADGVDGERQMERMLDACRFLTAMPEADRGKSAARRLCPIRALSPDGGARPRLLVVKNRASRNRTQNGRAPWDARR